MFLVVFFSLKNTLHSHLRGHDVPNAICAQNQTPVFQHVELIDNEIGFGTDDVNIIFGIVGPEVAQSSGDRQKRNLIDVGGPADGTLMASTGTIPHDPDKK